MELFPNVIHTGSIEIVGTFLPRKNLLEAGSEVVDGPGDHQVVVDGADKRDHQHAEPNTWEGNDKIRLRHLCRDKMADISRTTFLNAFS